MGSFNRLDESTIDEPGALAWLEGVLDGLGLKLAGEIDRCHMRAWGRVFAVSLVSREAPSEASGKASQEAPRKAWLKIPAEGFSFEAALYRLLGKVAPEALLTPLALEAERGWMLLPDGGSSLAETLEGDELVEAMLRALPLYGELQRRTLPHAGEMLGLGLADFSPEGLPERFDRAAKHHPQLSVPLSRLRGEFSQWCGLLAGSPLSSALDHNDLHPWNIMEPSPGGRPVIFDWGDSVVAHALGSSLIPISRVMRLNGLGADDGRVVRMYDAYLEPFDDLGSRAELRETMVTSWRVAKAARAVIWDSGSRAVEKYLEQFEAGELDL